VLGEADSGQAIIIDCLATWLTRLIDAAEGWSDRGRSEQIVARESRRLVSALAYSSAAWVALVTNEVGSGVVPMTTSGGLFRDLLGRVNTAISHACDDAVLLIAGRPMQLGALPPIDTSAPTEGAAIRNSGQQQSSNDCLWPLRPVTTGQVRQ